MARWETVLDDLIDLWKFSRSDRGISYHKAFANSVMTNSVDENGEVLKVISAEEIYARLPSMIESALFNSDPVYIDPDMMTVAEAAFGTMKPEPLQATDLFIPSGFMVLPRPIRIPDIRNKMVADRAMLWTPARFLYTVRDKEFNVLEEEKEPHAGIILFLFSHIDDDDDYWDEIEADKYKRRQLGANLILNHVEPWIFGDKHKTDDPRAIDPYIQTLWRLMAQTITVKSESRASKPFTKRAARATFPDKKITVVTLRRPRHDTGDHEPTNVEWSHRWLVSGHWRNQYFPSISTHRQIWIGKYIKGPDDKPLEVKKMRVFEWVQ